MNSIKKIVDFCDKNGIEYLFMIGPNVKIQENLNYESITEFFKNNDYNFSSSYYQLNDKNRSNFRVDTILSHWEDLLNTFSNGKEIEIENYTLFVSSGTYIRGICDSLYGTAMDINRIEFVP